MKNQITYGSLLFLLLLLHSASLRVKAQEVEDEREFDYALESKKGPRKWGDLKREWAMCKHGKMQSPIDMSNRRVKIIPQTGKFKRAYKACNATIRNRGHDIMVQWIGDAGSIKINGLDYSLHQAHWHSPSEHSINGRRFDMELHLVHQSSNPNVRNSIAVVAVLYKIGKQDHFLSKLARNISSMIDTREELHYGIVNPSKIKSSDKSYHRYMGSLTVPPCTEGVIWTLNKKIRTVSRDQVNLLREAVHDYAERNARPLQPDNLQNMH